MKNAYRVMLIGLAVFGVVYASTGPEETTKDVKVKYEPLKIGTFPVFMKVGYYIKLLDAGNTEIKLEQVKCPSGRSHWCYKGCATIKVRANFPAILSASLNKSDCDVDMLKDTNLYWENGVNTIQGSTDGLEELKLCLEAWDVELSKSSAGTVKVGDITISVKPIDTQ
jgi:hypothetical protein